MSTAGLRQIGDAGPDSSENNAGISICCRLAMGDCRLPVSTFDAATSLASQHVRHVASVAPGGSHRRPPGVSPLAAEPVPAESLICEGQAAWWGQLQPGTALDGIAEERKCGSCSPFLAVMYVRQSTAAHDVQ